MQEIGKHARKARIALVGHEPNIGELAARLIGAPVAHRVQEGRNLPHRFRCCRRRRSASSAGSCRRGSSGKGARTEPRIAFDDRHGDGQRRSFKFLSNLDDPCLPLVRDGDSDGIHDARVATRRPACRVTTLSPRVTEGASRPRRRESARVRWAAPAKRRRSARLSNEIERRSPGAAAAAAALRAFFPAVADGAS